MYLFLFLTISLINAQEKEQRQFIKIDYKIENQNLTELQIEKKETNKIKDCLNYNCKNDLKLSYCNNNSEQNFVTFEEIGVIKNSKTAVIHKTTNNEEFYILANKDECKAFTLNGFPLKIDNSNQYIVYNNPPTDKPYIIQIINITNGIVNIQDEIIIPKNIVPKRLLSIKNSEAYILDNKDQIWKTLITEKN
jgi:hypothetical protein